MTSPYRLIAVTAALTIGIVVASYLAGKPNEPAPKPEPRLERIGGAEPEVSAEAFFVTHLGDEDVLFKRNEHEKLLIASLTKLMTSLLLVEKLDPLEQVVFSQEAKSIGAIDDKRSQVRAGDSLKAEDVLKTLLVASDNDAAYAVAEKIGGSVKEGTFEEKISSFIALMNERALSLGLTNTHFSNPAGSDDPENYSTAFDITLLARYIHRTSSDLWTVSRTQETFVFGSSGERYGVVNTDPLFAEYPSLWGSKTGFDDDAKGSLILLYALSPDDIVLIVILKSDDRFGDGRKAVEWVETNFRVASHTVK